MIIKNYNLISYISQVDHKKVVAPFLQLTLLADDKIAVTSTAMIQAK